MKKIIVILPIILLSYVYSLGQNDSNYAVSNISEELRKNASAVIRYSEEDIEIESSSHAIHKVKLVITILKGNAQKYANLQVSYDKFSKIKSISGKIYDKNGKFITKVKSKEIHDFASFDGFSLFSDNRMKYINKPSISLPYTVEYEYTEIIKGILSLPAWIPAPDFNISVENAILKVSDNSKQGFRFKEINFEGKSYKEGNTEIREITNMKAIKREPLNNNIEYYLPIIYLAPNGFKLAGYEGNATSWKNFGQWIYELNEGRDYFSDKTISDLNSMVKNAKTDEEKAKILYKYMQNNCRYVSIQLGIGGWQPFKAKTVAETGYGDCKALSNYMFAMLKAVNVKSHYTIVDAGNQSRKMITDFSSNQFDHAILCMPNNGDTIWLECTSQTAPFGYIGSATDDRDVLIITPEGGKIAHTTIYTQKQNLQLRKAKVLLNPNGNINAEMHTEYSGIQYENVYGLFDLSQEDKIKYLQKTLNLPNVEVNKIEYKNYKEIIPKATENISLQVKNYASQSGKRLFLPINLLNKSSYVPKELNERKTIIIQRRAYTDIDSITYILPSKYKAEYLPETKQIKTKFGEYYSKTTFVDNKVTYVRKLILNKGNFPKTDYTKIREFYQVIYEADSENAVFISE